MDGKEVKSKQRSVNGLDRPFIHPLEVHLLFIAAATVIVMGLLVVWK